MKGTNVSIKKKGDLYIFRDVIFNERDFPFSQPSVSAPSPPLSPTFISPFKTHTVTEGVGVSTTLPNGSSNKDIVSHSPAQTSISPPNSSPAMVVDTQISIIA